MTGSTALRHVCAVLLSVSAAGCGSSAPTTDAPPVPGPAASAPAPPASAQAAGASRAGNPCPLTVEQVAAVTGTPMTLPPGGCTFFPANGRDIPHVFYVLQIPTVCSSIAPGALGFTEAIDGLPARAAYFSDRADGSHLLVCRDNARAFDIVVDIRNDKDQNREAAITLARQVLADR